MKGLSLEEADFVLNSARYIYQEPGSVSRRCRILNKEEFFKSELFIMEQAV